MTLGEIIKEYRTRTGESMDIFAKKSGLSKAYVSVLERNINPISQKPPIPSVQKIKAVAAAVGLDFNDVIAMLDEDSLISIDESPDEYPAPHQKDERKIENPDIRMIARAGKKMTPEQAENLRKYAQYMFPEAFTDDDT